MLTHVKCVVMATATHSAIIIANHLFNQLLNQKLITQNIDLDCNLIMQSQLKKAIFCETLWFTVQFKTIRSGDVTLEQ